MQPDRVGSPRRSGRTQKYLLSEEGRRLLIATYDSQPETVAFLSGKLNAPRWRIAEWAIQLGLNKRKPRWTEADNRYLEAMYHRMSVADIARERGHTQDAVQQQAWRLGINKLSEGYTLRSLSVAMGCSNDKVARWIRQGWLKASRRKTCCPNDTWYISYTSVYDFVTAHPEEVNKERADPLWLREVLAGPYGLGVLVSPDCD